MVVTQEVFGTFINPMTKEKEKVHRYILKNTNNMVVHILSYGATIHTIRVPDKTGKSIDVCLGFDDMPGYQTETNPYIGGTIGRVCSRIGKGRFTLDGKEYKVSRNFLKKHMLHGGFCGFDKNLWFLHNMREDGISLRFVSTDGHEGFPGEVTALVHFTLTEDNSLNLHFEAETTKNCPVNLCNHAYFNLAGHDAGKMTLYEHFVKIAASRYTLKDRDTVPTGEIQSLHGTHLDVSKWTNIGVGIRNMTPEPGYDDNYCLDLEKSDLTNVASAWHPGTGILMEIMSDQLAMHFYTSHNMPDVRCGATPTIFGKDGAHYEKHGSFCLETSGFPDAMNHSEFPPVILHPGEKYSHKCNFKFSTISELPTN